MFDTLLKICKTGDYESLEKILEDYYFDAEDSLSSKDQNQLTLAAAENGHSKVLNLLLINECSCDGEALRQAFFNDHLECFKLIIQGYQFEFSEEILIDIEYFLKKLPEKRREKYFYLLIHSNKVLPRKILRSRQWQLLKNYNYCFKEEDVQYLDNLRFESLHPHPQQSLQNFIALDRNYIEVSKFFDIQQEAIKVCNEGNYNAFKFLKQTFALPLIEEYLKGACYSKNFELIDYITSYISFKFKIKNITKSTEIKLYLKKRRKVFDKDESESESESD
jgi:hypothetical protein